MKYKELRKKLNNPKIEYYSKIELIKSEVETEIVQRWAVKVAESVLHIYEKDYPNDMRVRDCIIATTQYLDGKINKDELIIKRKAANDAVNTAVNNAAYNAANTAANAASNAAVYAAFYTAAKTAANKTEQQELNIKLLLGCLVKEIPDTKLGRKLYPNAEITGNKLRILL